MNRKIISLIVFALIILFTPITFACPPSTSEFLYIKDVYVSSDEFHILTTNLEKENYSMDYKIPIGLHPYFNFSGNPEYLRISIDDYELLASNISSLKSEITRYARESPQAVTNDIKLTIQVYELPNSEMLKKLRELNNLSYYDNKHLKIFLDDKLVREFSIGYKPAMIYQCSNSGGIPQPSSQFSLDAKLIMVLLVLLIGVVTVVFKMRK